MKAVNVLSAGKAEIQDAPLPKLKDGEVLVKIKCVAINPSDWKVMDMLASPGTTLGHDFAGEVVEVGSNMKKPWKVGDRICGWVAGVDTVNNQAGAFAEYCSAVGELCVRIPDEMSYQEAAAMPASILTAGMGLFYLNDLELPGDREGGRADGETVLVYGGNSATGTMAIQLARLAGYEVVTTCSSHAFDQVKSFGATVAFDYKDPDCGEKINEYTKDSLSRVVDCIANDSSPAICAAAVSSKGGTIAHTSPYPEDFTHAHAVKTSMLSVFGMWGRDFGFGEHIIPGNPLDYEFAKKMYVVAEQLMQQGRIVNHPLRISDTGLSGVFDGMQEVKAGRAGGVKLICNL